MDAKSLWTEVAPEEGDLHRHWSYAGLEVHDVGGDEEDFFTVSLRSYPSLLLLPTNAERAFEIATALANLRDWICVADWDRETPMFEQIKIAIRFAGEAEIPQPSYLGPFMMQSPRMSHGIDHPQILRRQHRGMTMTSPWTFIHQHRDPNHPDLRGLWPNEAEARECNGLVLVPFYDPHRGITLSGWWELRHRLSNDPILFIRADDEETAEEYATKVAEMAHWDHMRTVPEWTAPPHSHELIDYLNSTYQVFYQPNFEALWSKPASREEMADDWDREVPYGA